MSLRGVTLQEGRIGANVAGDSREFGIICSGIAVQDKAQLNTTYKLLRPSDAEAIGITEEYDTTNKVRVYRHISEFYRRAGEGRALHLRLIAQSFKPADMVESAKILVVEADGMISDLAFGYNPPAGYLETMADGFNSDVRAAIGPLQQFAVWTDENDMPLHTILEGRALADDASGAIDLRALKVGDATLEAAKVTIVFGQDWVYADTLDDLGKKYADVGTFLGVIASQAWNRNPGEVETQNLTDATLGVWTIGGLSNHKKYSEVFESLESLNDKGYVFPIKYQGLTGYWWNDGHVCAPIIIDAQGNMNQHMIYYSHTMDEAKRNLRRVYLPEVKKPVQLESGKLPTGMVGYYNAIGDREFERLAGNELISEGKTYTDANSDLLIAKVLNIDFGVVPTGCINEILGTINLKNQA
ncbi:hypothetical protein D0T84_01245 [Dysgonomonas sp. 521]|uniref:DUF2586 family protein n=1 Tax=Dysgonomonas sp. 521 TaxID=2302932 RepID=UPI0013D6FD55|nr:DUF2586 family protein [Dysgonomonas sp. 521]NDV93542.1 hypothetical protein [Dysgonomonas sp. 521]